LSRKQVHLLMPDDLHRQVKQKADEAGVSLTAYLLSLIEADLQSEPYARNNIYGLALRVRAIEVHLGLDSRHPGQRLAPALKQQLSQSPPTVESAVTSPANSPLHRRASDLAEPGDEVIHP
jgi:hypothetical protein